MYSQKNVTQVFVSNVNSASKAAIALANLVDGEIGIFDAISNVSVIASVAANGGYIAVNNSGVIKKSAVFHEVVAIADIVAYDAPVAPVKTVTIPDGLAIGTYYQVSVTVKGENHNGDEIKQGNYKSKTGDVLADIVAGVLASLVASIARDSVKQIIATSGVGTIIITSRVKEYVPGRKKGGYWKTEAGLTSPEASAVKAAVTAAGTDGIGTGWYVNLKELFAMGNSDAVSKNEFRTGFPNTLLSSVTAGYNLLTVYAEDKKAGTTYADVPVPGTIICAFDKDGGAPVV